MDYCNDFSHLALGGKSVMMRDAFFLDRKCQSAALEENQTIDSYVKTVTDCFVLTILGNLRLFMKLEQYKDTYICIKTKRVYAHERVFDNIDQ